MPTVPRPAVDRFWDKVEKTGTCWLWTGSLHRHGYGQLSVDRKWVGAHRLSYELHRGQIPPGLVIDHTCHNPACVNPEHLQAVTQVENAQNRAGAQRRNSTGVRGVRWREDKRKYEVRAFAQGVAHWGGLYNSLADAEVAAIALRNRVMANNLADRI